MNLKILNFKLITLLTSSVMIQPTGWAFEGTNQAERKGVFFSCSQIYKLTQLTVQVVGANVGDFEANHFTYT